MANPSQQVPTESVPFSEEKVYWPANPSLTSDVTYSGEMIGMRADTGYAEHFDDAAPKVFLGTKEQITSRFQSDTPGSDFKYLIRRPKLFAMPLNTGVTATATIPGSIGSPAYAADSGHVQLSTSGLTNGNLAGMVVDISRSYSTATVGGIQSLTTANTTASVVVSPPQFGALIGLIAQGFVGSDATVAATVGGNAPAMLVTAGRGGNTTGTGASTGGNGAGVTVTAGAGGNAAAGTGNGGTGGTIALAPGIGGTSAGGTAGVIGSVKIAGPLSSPLTAAQALVTGNTITLPTTGKNRIVTCAAAVTGAILTAGRFDGDEIVVVNNSGNSCTFATAGTSNVADGTSAVIAANTRMTLVWSATATLWFHGN